MKKTLILIVILIIAIIIIIFVSNKSVEAPTNSTNTLVKNEGGKTDSTNIDNIPPRNDTQTQDVLVKYDVDGFLPKSIKVKLGQTVIFENQSSHAFWPASDDHPTHKMYSEFDTKEAVPAGSSYSFKFDKVGTWNYHNHMKASETGVVIVE